LVVLNNKATFHITKLCPTLLGSTTFDDFLLLLAKVLNRSIDSFVLNDGDAPVLDQSLKLSELTGKTLAFSHVNDLPEVFLKADLLDPWTSSNKSVGEQKLFKTALIQYYRVAETNHGGAAHLQCMLTGQSFPRKSVTASHIWKKATNGKGLPAFGIDQDKIDDPRNGLLLLKGIEDKFDNKQLCFLYDFIHTKFECKILDPGLLKQTLDHPAQPGVRTSLTFADIDKKSLILPPGIFPYRRLLNWHARMSFVNAKKQGWVNLDAVVSDYFTLSETSSGYEVAFDVFKADEALVQKEIKMLKARRRRQSRRNLQTLKRRS